MNVEPKVKRFDKNIEILKLDEWLNCTSGCDTSLFVALPLIQRGFVWKPKQIIDLWDTLLRGMPMGSLMYSLIPPGVEVREIGGKDLIKTPESGAIGLIDGQQRTLAMLIPWEKVGEKMDRRIWVDFFDKPSDEHLFRLYVTTKNQPFGFQKTSPSTKLPLGERTAAREEFIKQHKKLDLSQDFLFKMAKPYHAKFPLDLRILIEGWKHQSNLGNQESKSVWVNKIEEMLERMIVEKLSIDDLELAKIRISRFADALERFFALQIPLLKVDPALFSVNDLNNSDHNENNDPPLAILFKRVGTGGTLLSDADYAYSIIKNLHPETYTLVEALYSAGNIASLLSPTDLVMTTVRLVAAEYKEKLTDWESPRKIEFHRLIKHDGFLKDGFLPLIRSDLLNDAFASLTKLLKFDKKNNPYGLPLHTFPLLNRPLIQVLLRWIRIVQLRVSGDVNFILEQSRGEILRFIMYWQLGVIDQRKASLIAFQQFRTDDVCFSGKEIYKTFIKERVAIPIASPEKILEVKQDVVFSPDATRLRGWERFDTQRATEEENFIVSLYQRWWGNGHYVHPLLLWLQREIVAEFDGSPVAGREEDTPYDYDHICPVNHWGNWTGSSKGNRLIDFLARENNGGHWRVGNSIGNLRVWQSGENRSYGDATPSEKLKFDNPIERDKLLQQSAIDSSQIEGWKICSDGEKCWNETRAQAFQKVIEQRAFALYKCFYCELGFSEWS
ncbi:MAG: DUF262 domain-containing protein [Nitrosomonas sp.]|uniref:DUF262 domain-containing protein n=1 Tax=Nitrosomonas sp. TaxID=42353 RepID=UPI0032ECE8E4